MSHCLQFSWQERADEARIQHQVGWGDSLRKQHLSEITLLGKDRWWMEPFLQKGSKQLLNPTHMTGILLPVLFINEELSTEWLRVTKCYVLTLHNPETPSVQTDLPIIKISHKWFPKIPTKLFNNPGQMLPMILFQRADQNGGTSSVIFLCKGRGQKKVLLPPTVLHPGC